MPKKTKAKSRTVTRRRIHHKKDQSQPIRVALLVLMIAAVAVWGFWNNSMTNFETDEELMEQNLVVPAAAYVVFESDRTGNGEIFRMKVDGSGLVNLTNNPAYDHSPSVSKDGKKIVFVSHRSNSLGDGHGDIYLMNIDGTGVTSLTTNRVDDYQPAFSPNGTQVVYSSLIPASGQTADNRDIYKMNIADKKPVRLTTHWSYERNPAFSPDGKKIVYLRESNMYTMNADGSSQAKLSISGVISLESPTYSPDGKKIAFASRTIGENVNTSIYTVSINGGNPTKLTQTLFPVTVNGYTSYITDLARYPSYFPDGRIIYTTTSNKNAPLHPNQNIYMMNADGTGKTRLTTTANPKNDSKPRVAVVQ